MITLSLLVLKTSQPDALSKQYELLGITFDYHKHESGPYHYAATVGKLTFEIYPLPKSKTESDNTTRIGFEVTELDRLMEQIPTSNWKIISPASQTEWGYSAIIEDLDGRKVELKKSEK